MKKLLAIMILCLATVAQAQHRPYHHHHHRHHHGGHNWGWVAPALIGGAIVYGLTHTPSPPPQTVVVVPPGYPVPPQGYRYDQILDANCSCYRWVLVQAY